MLRLILHILYYKNNERNYEICFNRSNIIAIFFITPASHSIDASSCVDDQSCGCCKALPMGGGTCAGDVFDISQCVTGGYNNELFIEVDRCSTMPDYKCYQCYPGVGTTRTNNITPDGSYLSLCDSWGG